ncbi:ATP-binding cassette domain-containing protein [Bartonella henselae]|uniref:ATP-binding cassette domain-containing protein n=1 Tax=Bartonella henselae TaxID=38323 RepID=UPI000A5A2DFE|nr:ATP-binding cassette domain-containing protein [Bartonella henselae]MDM9997389.1 ATP-binding cassette domain-containing protein [Bartonella henselae]
MFSYGETPIINPLDVCLQPGKLIMFLGPSGCGKSTLARLLCALYPPSSGQILVNYQSLQNFNICSVRKTIAYFPQSPYLLSGIILKNMYLAKPNATEDEINAAICASTCYDLLLNCLKGLPKWASKVDFCQVDNAKA